MTDADGPNSQTWRMTVMCDVTTDGGGMRGLRSIAVPPRGMSRQPSAGPSSSAGLTTRPAVAARVVGTIRSRWQGLALAVCGVAMVPWLVVLAVMLPTTASVPHWSTAWIGLDTLEAVGLTTTGVLLMLRRRRYVLTASATATVLVIDAWFDLLSAHNGGELLIAIAMGVGAELPLAAICALLALRGLSPSADR